MKKDWHDPIQRHLAGLSSAEETAELQNALKADAKLRSLFLDYANLDAALGALADAAEFTPADLKITPAPHARWLAWRPLAAAAACAALFAGSRFYLRPASRSQPDIAEAFASAEEAIAHLPAPQSTPLPEWMSPTAGMLRPAELPHWKF